MSRFFRRQPSAAMTASESVGSVGASASATPNMSTHEPSAPTSSAASVSSHKTASSNAEKQQQLLILRPDPHETIVEPLAEPKEEERPLLERLRAHLEELIRRQYYDADGQPRPDGSKNEATGGQKVERSYEKWEKRWLDAKNEEPAPSEDGSEGRNAGLTTVRRYLKASAGSEADAKKRLESTLIWRRSFKPDLIQPEYVRPEAETGKHILSGFDKKGRSLLYLMPGRENTKSGPRQIAAVTWWLERAIDVLPRGQTKITLVIDFYKANQGNTPNLATSKEVLDIVQKHFPERLGMAVIVNAPWWMNAMFAALGPFIDAVTKSKILWNPQPDELIALVPRNHLQKAYGGTYDYVFEKDSYWDQVVNWCGIAPDGTREHECLSKLNPEEEAAWIAKGERPEATEPNEPAAGAKPAGAQHGSAFSSPADKIETVNTLEPAQKDTGSSNGIEHQIAEPAKMVKPTQALKNASTPFDPLVAQPKHMTT